MAILVPNLSPLLLQVKKLNKHIIEKLVYQKKFEYLGDSSNQIHFEAYQVSNQCTALVRDGCMIPTFDAPELAYIRESSNDKYIPDVYFRVYFRITVFDHKQS